MALWGRRCGVDRAAFRTDQERKDNLKNAGFERLDLWYLDGTIATELPTQRRENLQSFVENSLTASFT